MTEPKEYSSLPLVLAISGAILLSAAVGWVLLDREPSEPADEDAITLAIVGEQPTPAGIDVDSELRKARLAADADILVNPPEQSALYFYGRVMAADPGHRVANAEFNAVLARVSLIVSGYLATGEFDEAYRLAVLVARHKPDHTIVVETRKTLNDYAARLVEQAMQHARDGNDDDATALLESAENLPGLNAEYFAAVRASIADIRQLRLAAEREQVEAARLEAEQAELAWTEKVRSAIATGQLIAPAGDSARDYLAQQSTPEEVKAELADELLAALITAGEQSIDAGELANAEQFLDAANDLSEDHEAIAELRDTLETKLIEAEGNKILGLNNFVRVKSAPARYPRRANQHNITGWVEVAFTVTSVGKTADIEVLRADPEGIFETAAIRAVEKWAFEPREYRGQLIDQRTAARVVFQLE